MSRDLKNLARKAYHFLFKEDSVLSWVVNVVLAFILVKFVIYPGLSLILGTTLPLVAVISGSMDHTNLGFDDWWEQNQDYYQEIGISKEMFDGYMFTNGFKKGDVMILVGVDNVEMGDVLVYSSSSHPYPIIHRVTYINEDNTLYQFKGDHNQEPDAKLVKPEQILGKAVVKIPWVGWVKIWFAVLLETVGII
jgi:signal peptidase I